MFPIFIDLDTYYNSFCIVPTKVYFLKNVTELPNLTLLSP